MSKQISNNWSVIRAKINGLPVIVRISRDTEELKQKNFFYRIGVATPILHPENNGMPIPEENIVLQGMEEDILKMAEENDEAELRAVILGNGVKEMVFYAKKVKPDFLEDASKRFQNYSFQWYGKEDREYMGLKQLSVDFTEIE